MLKRFSHFFAYLLLVLMPLQGFAAANMAACNSMMQAEKLAEHMSKQVQKMPCHEQVAEKTEASENHKSTCKATCATLCASLCAMTAIPSNIKPAGVIAASQPEILANQTYASITLPNLQRPPILLS